MPEPDDHLRYPIGRPVLPPTPLHPPSGLPTFSSWPSCPPGSRRRPARRAASACNSATAPAAGRAAK
ncbi:MAG: hypothetical protein WKG07_35230 [Hymenobacter sp.]